MPPEAARPALRALISAIGLIIVGCVQPDRVTAPPAKGHFTISDGRSGGTEGFYFLPPLVPPPQAAGTFDATVEPEVSVCELTVTTCGNELARFTMKTSPAVTLDLEGESYALLWQTKGGPLAAGRVYRVAVRVGAFTLGYADLAVVASPGALKSVPAGLVGVAANHTINIRFRIETGIVASIALTPPSALLGISATKAFTVQGVDLHGAPLTISDPVIWSASAANISVSSAGVVNAVSAGEANLTAWVRSDLRMEPGWSSHCLLRRRSGRDLHHERGRHGSHPDHALRRRSRCRWTVLVAGRFEDRVRVDRKSQQFPAVRGDLGHGRRRWKRARDSILGGPSSHRSRVVSRRRAHRVQRRVGSTRDESRRQRRDQACQPSVSRRTCLLVAGFAEAGLRRPTAVRGSPWSPDPMWPLYRYRLAVVGAWLGAVDPRIAASHRTAISQLRELLTPSSRAEVAWLDGLLAAARGDMEALTAARDSVKAADPVTGPFLERSLSALALAGSGRRARAADSLVALEHHRAESGWSRYRSDAHPFLTGVNRLAAARWLLERGDVATAERLLTWHQAILFPLQDTREANVILEPVACLEQARAAAALGRRDHARAYYQRFLWRYDAPPPQHRSLVQEAHLALARLGG